LSGYDDNVPEIAAALRAARAEGLREAAGIIRETGVAESLSMGGWFSKMLARVEAAAKGGGER
jgi:hypothetical protein